MERPGPLDFQGARAFCPQVKGCLFWHEARANRARCKYESEMYSGGTSWAISKHGLPTAMLFCVDFLWTKHSEVTGAKCPYDFTDNSMQLDAAI